MSKARSTFPSKGLVTSDVSLIGFRGFDRSKNILRLGRVKQADGMTATLRIRVRGPWRDDVQLKVASLDPAEALEVEIGERAASGGDAVHMYPVDGKDPGRSTQG